VYKFYTAIRQIWAFLHHFDLYLDFGTVSANMGVSFFNSGQYGRITHTKHTHMNTIQREINNMTNLLDEQETLIEQIKTDHVATIRPMVPSVAVIKAMEAQGYTFDDKTSYVNTGGVRRLLFIHPTAKKELRISIEESLI